MYSQLFTCTNVKYLQPKTATEKMTKKFSFIKPTLKFCIAGIFIPGFTAVIILGLQQGIQWLGVECSISWTILWVLTAVAAVATPVIFIKIIKKMTLQGSALASRDISIFNILQYTFSQSALVPLFTKGQTLCYVTDGQNGIELVFTGWLAIPILILSSRFFDLLELP